MAEDGVGRFGEGDIHGKPVSWKSMSRFHPAMGTTVNSHPISKWLLKRRASSPMVRP